MKGAVLLGVLLSLIALIGRASVAAAVILLGLLLSLLAVANWPRAKKTED